MHTFQALDDEGSTYFFHNGDFSGEVIIRREGSEEEFRLPFGHLLQLVASYVRKEKISRLDVMGDNELLGIE